MKLQPALFIVFLSVLPLFMRAESINGPYPARVQHWTDEEKQVQRAAGRSLIALIEKARLQGEAELRVAKGDYRFAEVEKLRGSPHLILSCLQDMTIDFQGSTLWFERATTGIFLNRSRRATLKNVILDWDPLPYVQGVIEALDVTGNAILVRLDPSYEREIPGMPDGKFWRGAAFDSTTRNLKSNQIGWGVDFSWKFKQSDGAYRLPFRGFWDVRVGASGLSSGDPVALWDRRGHAVILEGNEDCVLENVTLYSSPFIGFAENTGDGGTCYRGCKILRCPGTNRLMAGNADGFNIACTRRGPVIESCEIDTIGDDFVNVHHFFSRVLAQEKPECVIVSPICYQGRIPGQINVEFFDRRTMEPLGERKATVEEIGAWKIQRGNCLADLSVRWMAGEAAGLDYGKSVRVHRLTLDNPLEVHGDAIVSCREFSSAGAIIRQNHFRGSLARGLRLQSPQITVENNVLEDIRDSAISLSGQPTRWGEGPYVRNARIVGNRIVRACMALRDNTHTKGWGNLSAAISIEMENTEDRSRIQGQISIQNNDISKTNGGLALFARSVNGLEISGNRVSGYLDQRFSNPSGIKGDASQRSCVFVLDNIKSLIMTDNHFESSGEFTNDEICILNAPAP